MAKVPSAFRTDEQLETLLDHIGDWVVNDDDGFIMWPLDSLRAAVRLAQERVDAGEPVRAVSRLPPERIIVSSDQIDRIMRRFSECDDPD
jgi:hypothetical protein